MCDFCPHELHHPGKDNYVKITGKWQCGGRLHLPVYFFSYNNKTGVVRKGLLMQT
jgi:hypothetical protein